MKDRYGLPLMLEDDLQLRWAVPADAEALAAFNIRFLSDDPAEPEDGLKFWTMDLMSGAHPVVKAGDFTVVTDESDGGKIVSSLVLISQQWTYDGLSFGCGRVELVATDPTYRKRGLVRRQMELIHAKSADRGDLVQAITGIPWFYRRFGYDMALNLGGSRTFLWSKKGNDESVEHELFRLRTGTVEDVADLMELYAVHCDDSLITAIRDENAQRFELAGAHRASYNSRHIRMIERIEGSETVGYVEYRQWGARWFVHEFAVRPGTSWREVALFLTRALKAQADEHNLENNPKIDRVVFRLGVQHKIYEALGAQLEPQIPPYAWYIRVADLPAFLRHITPLLEKRLGNSVLAGHTGEIKLNFYENNLLLKFDHGKLVAMDTYEPKEMSEGDALFPELTFLQLLFGYRSIQELNDSRADCYTSKVEAKILLNILFPKRWSNVIGLG